MTDDLGTSSSLICAALSVVSGLLFSIGVNIVAYDAHKRHNAKTYDNDGSETDDKVGMAALLIESNRTPSCMSTYCPIVLNVFFNLAGVGAFMLATKYGPVSVAMPIETASLLLINLFFMNYSGISQFDMTCLVGTLVLVSAAACLGDVGPIDATQGKEFDIFAMLATPQIKAWFFIQGFAGVACSIFLYHIAKKKGAGVQELGSEGDAKDWAHLAELFCFSFMVAVATSIGASLSKVLSITAGSDSFNMFFCFYCISGLGSIGGGALAAYHCDQSIYLPMNEVMKLLLNAGTGLLLWKDDPQKPLSYLMTYVEMCLAVYLCASMDKPHRAVQHESRRLSKTWTRMLG